jgi:ADP-ribosyl-[dinitrogen reductase] hydrolase
MVFEGALGDAYGAGFEFAAREVIDQQNHVSHYIPHPRFQTIYKKYTDDTQMALAIAELIIDHAEWTPLNIADKFVEVFKRDPREGYATRFYTLLTQVSSGTELLELINPDSVRNGAAMRAYPLGVIPDIEEIKEKAAIQASITHNTQAGTSSAQAIALMSFFTYHKMGSLKDLPEFLWEHQQVRWSNTWTGEVQIDGIQTVEALLTVLSHHNGSMRSLLINSVNLGGDVDTIASLALAIASNTREVHNDLPQWLSDEVENGPYGSDYIKVIDRKLQSMFPRLHLASLT